MNDIYDKLNKYWDNTSSNMAHRVKKFTLNNEKSKKVFKRIQKDILGQVRWKDKIVIDYGIGSGFIGHYLFKYHDLKRYIGFDVSQKSIEYAKNELKDYLDKSDFIFLNNQTYNFDRYSANIFMSLACIQHFPNEEYLNNFLDSVNESNIPIVIFQIRNNDETEFSENAYKGGSVLRACVTNNEYIINRLTNYKDSYQSDVDPRSNYQYLLYDRS